MDIVKTLVPSAFLATFNVRRKSAALFAARKRIEMRHFVWKMGKSEMRIRLLGA
jgi:hypothetical protein